MDPSTLDPSRKRVWFRCHHMGMHENDILFGTLADRHIDSFSDEQVETLEKLIEQNDVDLLKWVLGQVEPPEEFKSDILTMVQDIKKQL